VSAAQTLTSGLSSSSSGVRSSSSGGAAAERNSTSFRDALETASRSSASGNDDGRVSPDQAQGRKAGKGDRNTGGDDPSSRGGEGASSRTEPASLSELSAMLSSLGGASQASEDEQAFVVAGTASANADATGEAPDTGPVLPGQVGESGETLDADQLLLLLRSGAASKKTAETPDIVDIKVSVAGQETHLALGTSPTDVAAALAAQEAAETAAGQQQANGGGKAAAFGAALSQAADDAARSQRMREGAAGDGVAIKSDAGAASRAGTIAEDWGGRGSEGLADQGISGRDGGRSAADGRGSSGAGSQQQQGTGAFLSALASAPSHGTGAVRNGAEGDAGFDPVSDQIAAEVRAELRAGGLGETSSDGVVKVLHLELKPANLGSVTVRLTLKDNAITIHLEAQRQETLAVIERERQALAGALASAGYSVDGITAAPQGEMSRSIATLAGAADSGSSTAQGSPWGQDGQGQGLGSSAGGQGRSGHAGAGNPAYHHPSDNKDANVSGVRRDAEGLYV